MTAMLLVIAARGGEHGAIPQSALDLSAPQTFDTAASTATWSFSNGPEWPGAKGELEWREHAGRNGGGGRRPHMDPLAAC